MKKIKKPVSILLSLIMVFSLFTIVPFSASAAVGDVLSESEYLTFTAVEAGSSVTLKYANGTLKYNINNSGWQSYTAGTQIALSNAGDSVRFRGKDTTFNDSNFVSIGGKVACSGNVMSLRLDDNGMVQGLSEQCFFCMFMGCTGLTAAPELPETMLAEGCYSYMFYGCTSLTTAPALPATNLAEACYYGMFYDCENLTTAPKLPATTLANECYNSMFEDCERLTTAPELPATTLAQYCYYHMFAGCSSIKLSETKTAEYSIPYSVPSGGNGTTASAALTGMFANTGGTFKGTPEINKTYFVPAPAPATFKVYVKKPTNETYTTIENLTGETTVAQLKGIIADQIDIPVTAQRMLVFSGKQLEDAKTLAEYNIEEESTIHLVIRGYTVTWLNYDNSELGTTTVQYGATPSYDGADPTKPEDANNTYTFSGWSDGENTYGLNDTLPGVTADVTYTAQFDAVKSAAPITVSAVSGLTYDRNEHALVTKSGEGADVYYRLGSTGDWSTQPPTAANAGSYTVQWYVPETEQYAAIGSADDPRSVTVSIAKAALKISAQPKDMILYDGARLDKTDFVFSGDDADLIDVSGTTVTLAGAANYTPAANNATLKANDYVAPNRNYKYISGTEGFMSTDNYGLLKPSNKCKVAANGKITIAFNGKTYTLANAPGAGKINQAYKKTVSGKSMTVFRAVAIPTYDLKSRGTHTATLTISAGNNYNPLTLTVSNIKIRQFFDVTWKHADGTVLKTENLEYGTVPSYGSTPTKAADTYNTYTFTGWTDSNGTFYAKDAALPAVTGEATYTATFDAVAKNYFPFANLSLNGDIGVNFAIDTYGYDPEELKVNVSWYKYSNDYYFANPTNDPNKTVLPTKTIDSKTYFLATANVAAKEMADTITVKLYKGDTELAAKTYSVRDYALTIINAENPGAIDLALSEAKFAALKDLCKALLKYGSASEAQFDPQYPANIEAHTVDGIVISASDGVSYEDYNEAEIPAYTVPDYSGFAEGLTYYGSSIGTKTTTNYLIAFVGSNAPSVRYNGKTINPVAFGEGGVAYNINGIAAKNIPDDIVLNVNGEDVHFNMLAYITKALSVGDETLQSSVRALYDYGVKAKAYFNMAS